MLPLVAKADQSGKCGENLTWTFEESTGSLTITGSGAMYDFITETLWKEVPWENYLDKILTVVIGDGVTSIGDGAFRKCTGLISITIPNSLTSIGRSAFDGCSSITSITIPDGVTTISNGAFQNCRKLNYIKIPKSLKYILGNAFKGCYTSNKSVEIEDLESWFSIYFEQPSCNPLLKDGFLYEKGVVVEDLIIPDTITSIGPSVFYGCGSIKTLILHKNVTSIGRDAFDDCKNITKVYCYSEKAPQTDNSSFSNTYIENASLYIPESSITEYMTKEPWCKFGSILTLSGEDPSTSINDINANLNCLVQWNGNQSTIVKPWGSNYARGVDVTIDNYSDVNIMVTQIDVYDNETSMGSIPSFEQTEISGGSKKTFSFSVSSKISMPSTLPWVKVHYKIWKKEFIKDSRDPGTSDIKEESCSPVLFSNYYTLDGKQIKSPRKGVNIVRDSNGKTKKIVVK
jgi:hypothetical protein